MRGSVSRFGFASKPVRAAIAVLILAGSPPALAQSTVVDPAAEAARRAAAAADDDDGVAHKTHLGTYNMPAVVVLGQLASPYVDDELIGDYAQPRWTAQRLFPGTRIYVIPKGEIDVEQWFQFETPNGGGPTTVTTQSELEFGLPHRLQLDVYLIQQRETGVAGSGSAGNSIEMRYALANWGKLWGNPAVYVEYTSQTGLPDKVETKLLLGDALAAGWHWGVNLSLEQQTSGDRTTEKQFTAGLSRAVIDRVLQVGFETRLGWTDARGSRGHYARDTQVGPTFQFRPLTQMHIDFAPLFGTTHDSMARNAYVIFGWEF